MGFAGVAAAAATLGLFALPADAWAGSDTGLDLRGRLLTYPAPGGAALFAMGLSPAMRITPASGRWRYPAVLGVLLPEVGITFGPEHSAMPYLVEPRAPVGVWLDRHLGLELEPGLWIRPVPWDPDGEYPDLAFSLTATLLAR